MKGSQAIRTHSSFGFILMRKSLLPVGEVGELHFGSDVNALVNVLSFVFILLIYLPVQRKPAKVHTSFIKILHWSKM